MSINTTRYTVSYRDAKGFIGKVSMWITGDTTDASFFQDQASVAQAVKTAIGNLTNAAFQGDSGLSNLNSAIPVAYGTNAEYPAEFMKAVMTFQDAAGGVHRYKIPAPKLAIFDTDGVTVLNDGTQAAVVAFVAAMKTAVGSSFVSSRQGQALTNFIGGIQRNGVQQRRINEFIKSSHLVQGEGE